MITTLRTPESYLDEVSLEKWGGEFLVTAKLGYADQIKDVAVEAMRRMCEDAFKAQKEICKDLLESEFSITGRVADRILEAPTPTFDNQNKN